jgi:putative transposase
MARPLGIALAGGLYHRTARGNGRDINYFDNEDRHKWLDVLGGVLLAPGLAGARVVPDDQPLSPGCGNAGAPQPCRWHATTDRRLHARRRSIGGTARTGHLLQGRYKAVLVERKTYLLELARYVVLNPARARMAAGPRQWRWSSYRATVGVAAARPWLVTNWILDQFSTRAAAVARHVDFVRAGVG